MRKTLITMGGMTLPKFLIRCGCFSADRRMSQSRLSTILFGSGVTIARLRSGRSVTVRVLDRAVARLDALERCAAEKAAA